MTRLANNLPNAASKELGAVIKMFIEEKGVSGQAFAKTAHLDKARMYGIMKGGTRCTPQVTEELCKAMKLAPEHAYLMHVLSARASGFKV